MWGVGVNQPFPVANLYPVVTGGDLDRRRYYTVNLMNLPHHYHNGGVWPFIGAQWVRFIHRIGLPELARQELVRLAELNRPASPGSGNSTNGPTEDGTAHGQTLPGLVGSGVHPDLPRTPGGRIMNRAAGERPPTDLDPLLRRDPLGPPAPPAGSWAGHLERGRTPALFRPPGLPVSAVGDDGPGAEALATLNRLGVDTRAVAIRRDLPKRHSARLAGCGRQPPLHHRRTRRLGSDSQPQRCSGDRR